MPPLQFEDNLSLAADVDSCSEHSSHGVTAAKQRSSTTAPDPFFSRLSECSAKANQLRIAFDATPDSSVKTVCQSSMALVLPPLLEQAAAVVMEASSSSSPTRRNSSASRDQHLVSRTLHSIESYISLVEETIKMNSDAKLCERLNNTLASSGKYANNSNEVTCWVSAWDMSAPLFTMLTGPTISSCAKEGSSKEQFHVDIVPLVERNAKDVKAFAPLPRYDVTAQECSFQNEGFRSLLVEKTGCARIKLLVEPDSNDLMISSGCCHVRQVRVTQLNCLSSRGAIISDIYVSHTVPENSTTLTVMTSTFKTKNGEIPRLRVELLFQD